MQIELAERGDADRLAALLVAEFRELAPDAWPTLDPARESVAECFENGPVFVARDGDTSLHGIDLYPDPLAWLARLDANGPGQPDIHMAKRVGGSSANSGEADPT